MQLRNIELWVNKSQRRSVDSDKASKKSIDSRGSPKKSINSSVQIKQKKSKHCEEINSQLLKKFKEEQKYFDTQEPLSINTSEK